MSSFSIHQFSSGIRNPQQNREGKWVSGGYDKEIAKESYNVPPEIKKLLIRLQKVVGVDSEYQMLLHQKRVTMP